MSFVHSIKFRFTLWYLVVLGILLALLSIGVYLTVSHTLHQNLDDSLESRAAQLSDTRDILTTVEQGRFEGQIGEVVSFYFYSGDELRHVSYQGVDSSVSNEVVERAIDGRRSFTTVERAEGGELRVYAVPFSPDNPGIQSAALVVGRSTEDTEQALDVLRRTLLIAVPLTMVLAGAGGVFLARRALKPVDQMTQTAQNIEESDLSRRIEVHTNDELGRLASTLNQMIERLEKAFQRQRQFTGDASHELRAPLAVIQAESTLALQKKRSASEYRQSLETISQETSHMSNIIDKLLTLARADAGATPFAFTEVALHDLVEDVAKQMRVLADAKGLQFEVRVGGSVRVRGDEVRLRELLLILLDNAIKFTDAGGAVGLTLEAEDGKAVVRVTDSGRGISPEDLPHVFDRFYRVDKARSRAEGGTGLGLAIAKWIVEGHGGSIRVDSYPDRGTTFTVELPVLSG